MTAGSAAVLQIPVARRAHLASLCAELHLETTTRLPDANAELAQRSLLTLILNEVARADSYLDAAPGQPALVRRALRFIEANCFRPISLSHVAVAVRRSPSHVATAVKAATGRTVMSWIIAGRIAEARRRLLHTDEHVDIISERIGYADPTHFIRLFRRAHGTTPASWRMQHRCAPPPRGTRASGGADEG